VRKKKLRGRERKRERGSERQVHHGDTPSIILPRERERIRKGDRHTPRTPEKEKERRT